MGYRAWMATYRPWQPLGYIQQERAMTFRAWRLQPNAWMATYTPSSSPRLPVINDHYSVLPKWPCPQRGHKSLNLAAMHASLWETLTSDYIQHIDLLCSCHVVHVYHTSVFYIWLLIFQWSQNQGIRLHSDTQTIVTIEAINDQPRNEVKYSQIDTWLVSDNYHTCKLGYTHGSHPCDKLMHPNAWPTFPFLI